MAAYKTLKGQSIRQVAQDPANPILGEIWYNTTLGVLKGYQTTATNYPSTVYSGQGCGVITAGLVAGW
jgi:hypothetical protein